MNHYQSNAPRFTIAFAAIALTVVTIGAAVIAPARMNFRSHEVPVVALTSEASDVKGPSAGDAARVETIDVTAVREARLVTVVESSRHALASRRG